MIKITTSKMTSFASSSLLFLILSCFRISYALESNSLESPQDVTSQMCAGQQGRGTDCEVLLDVPEACVPQACPVVFFLHGSGGTNNWFARTSGVHSIPVIGVYPQGEHNGWNTGPKNTNLCQPNDFSCTSDPDEGAFFAHMISELRNMGANGNIYVIGSSNGGALANRLAANAGPELPIAGIVSLVTQLLQAPERSGPGVLNYNYPTNGRSEFVSVLNIMGTADGVIPYEGGPAGVLGGADSGFLLMHALDSMTQWANHNGCDAENPVQMTMSSDKGDLTAEHYVYNGCSEEIIVEHYALNGAGHDAGQASIDGVSISYDLAMDFIQRCEGGGSPPTGSPPTGSPPTGSPPTGTPAGGECDDDPTWHGKFNVQHDCDYIAESPSGRCGYVDSNGVSAFEACPGACEPSCLIDPPTPVPMAPVPAPTIPCADDATWHGKFDPLHTCAYVGLSPNNRCGFENTDGVNAYNACPVSCDTGCAVPNMVPVAAPVPAPVPMAPIAAPSAPCVDDATWHGKFSEDHTCAYVGMSPSNRCGFEDDLGVNAYNACPLSCNASCSAPVASPVASPVAAPMEDLAPTSEICDDDENWHGKYSADHNCAYVAENPTIRCQWEDLSGVTATVACRSACVAECAEATG